MLAAAGFFALVALSPGGCVVPPKVKLSDIEVASLSFKRLDLVFVFDVKNPNLFDARLKAFDCRFAAADRRIADGSAVKPIPVIPAGGSRTVPVAVGISLADLAGAVRLYRSGRAVPYELTGRPVFNVLNLSLPVAISHRGEVPPLLVPRWKLKGISLRKGAEPAFLVTFEITNPSSFSLALEGVRGSLRLAGRNVLELSQTKLTELPGGKTVELVIPVRIRLAALVGAAAEIMADRRKLKFDGEFKLKAPLSIRKMLLGKAGGE